MTEQLREYNHRKLEEYKLAYAAFIPYYPFTLEDLDGEVWRIIDEHYHVSNFGRIKSFWFKTPRIIKPLLNTGGYLYANLILGGERKPTYIHILVAQAFIPNPDKKPEVNHDDGHKFNCHVSNLYWATRAENQQHAVKNGLIKSGEEHHNAKLIHEKVRYIRENPDNLTQDELATMFDMTQASISRIQLGETYQNAGGTFHEKQKRGWYQRIPDEQREQIRTNWATGNFTQPQLAAMFGCNRTTIQRIIHEG